MKPHSPTQTTHEADAPLDAWPRPSVTVDVVVMTVEDAALHVALYQRAIEPELGSYALPGGFVNEGESLDAAAERVLATKVGLHDVFLEQLYTFGEVAGDPRGRVVTVAYYALVDAVRFHADRVLRAHSARFDIPWPGETGGPVRALNADGEALSLFLDHPDIIGLAVKRLRGKLDYTPVGFQLLPDAFTLRDLQTIHEVVRAEPVNKDSIRRRMLVSVALGSHRRLRARRRVSSGRALSLSPPECLVTLFPLLKENYHG